MKDLNSVNRIYIPLIEAILTNTKSIAGINKTTVIYLSKRYRGNE